MQDILIIRFGSLGDIVLTEPIVRQLRRHHPDSEIHYLTKARYGELLSMIAGVDHVHLWESEKSGKKLVKELRRLDLELTVDLHDNLRSQKVRSAIGVRWEYTRKEWFKRFASVRMKWLHTKPSHAIERYAAAIIPTRRTVKLGTPNLHVREEFRRRWADVRAAGSIPESYFVIAAGAAHETKQAPGELWAQVAKEIAEESGLKALLVGAPHEQTMMENLRTRLTPNCAGILCEESIGLSAAAMAGSQFVLSNDSGSAHLAAAVGRPTLALFGPTHPILGFAPRGIRAGYYSVNEYCSPCSLHGKRLCHREQRYCFSKMDATKIVERIKELVSKEDDDE